MLRFLLVATALLAASAAPAGGTGGENSLTPGGAHAKLDGKGHMKPDGKFMLNSEMPKDDSKDPRLIHWMSEMRGNSMPVCNSTAMCWDSRACEHESHALGWTGRTDVSNGWHVCFDVIKPKTAACRVVSIGLGGEFEFEDEMTKLGCEVHAFDPTVELQEKHRAHAKANGWTFHPIGLAGSSGAVTDGSGNVYGHLDASSMLPLQDIFALSFPDTPKNIDYLKVDCEGCEWAALAHVKKTSPDLLKNVKQLAFEIHMTPSYGVPAASDMTLALDFIEDSGFSIFRTFQNIGARRDRNKVPRFLHDVGWTMRVPNYMNDSTAVPCCAEVHWVKR